MDKQDLWLIELVQLCSLYQMANRKGNCITCKAKSSSWQSQKTSKLQLGQGLVFKMEQYWIDEHILWLMQSTNQLGAITKDPQATLGSRPSFERWCNIGWMNRIYGRQSCLNCVHFTKMQFERQFVSLALPNLAWGNHKRPTSYTWVKAQF